MFDKVEYMKKYRAENKDKAKIYRKKWEEAHKNDPEYMDKKKKYFQNYYQNKKKNMIAEEHKLIENSLKFTKNNEKKNIN